MNNYLLIVSSLNRGRIENYFIQLATALYANGNTVTILALSDQYEPELKIKAEKVSRVISLKLVTRNFCFPDRATLNLLFGLNKGKVLSEFGDIDRIIAPSSYALVVANAINDVRVHKCDIVAGVYHSREFTWNTNRYHRRVERALFSNALSCGKVHVYGKELLRELFNEYGLEFREINTFPLGVDLEQNDVKIGSYHSRNIVIIARFVKFKSYIYHFIENFAKLLELDSNFRLKIYGYGPEKERYEKIISSNNLDQYVELKSPIELSDFKNVLRNCLCFVGGGTALLHAASLGIPCIVGLDNNPDITSPGFFSNIKVDAYNELTSYASEELSNTINIIDELISLSKDSYEQLSMEHVNKSRKFNVIDNVRYFNLLFTEKNKQKKIQFSITRYSLSFLFSRFDRRFINRFDRL